VHQRGTLAGECLVPGAQRAILVPEMLEQRDQLLDPLRQPHELQIDLCFCSVAHADDYRAALFRRSILYNDSVHMLQPDYSHIQQLLAQERALADAAEAHGTLAGCLCAASGYRFEDWLREILPEGRAAPESAATLQELYAATAGALQHPDMEFELLLPEDAQPIDARTAALAQWCQGFLYGLGAGAIHDASELPGDVGEVVRDFAEITRAGVDVQQGEESNESAYADLVEFVRVGVQLLFEELSAARQPAAAPPALH
jgi:uncharacterized protein